MREELQIELLRVTVSETKLSLSSSLNDHMRSYITVLTERRGSVTTVVRRAGNRLDADAPVSRRDDISLQSMATFTAVIREAEEDVMMRVMLLQLIDTVTFNLAFLTVTEAAATS
ncbi:uncharacterized protein BDCG_04648 [Blastomyces dermatitidis ER-3]|uniref:Uncharacterized protein n=1 Tax=Ajellomyces dermatitidis (strain ER-3 / ATCC MYA-2586) TaxID=559297 RepID=A0ABP2EZ12_AJEDR|nr:uncharacterized protein BDCG_04648 [Blastomyces dermatitidis ER-3]EEQ89528.1 hypothetical protein BDCG_04648 [Blastomyces dermatitidis ER-3]